jgi:hypothetical protein
MDSLKGEEYHCSVDLLFDWFRISCMTTENFLFLFAKQDNPNQSKQEVNGTVILSPLIFLATSS